MTSGLAAGSIALPDAAQWMRQQVMSLLARRQR